MQATPGRSGVARSAGQGGSDDAPDGVARDPGRERWSPPIGAGPSAETQAGETARTPEQRAEAAGYAAARRENDIREYIIGWPTGGIGWLLIVAGVIGVIISFAMDSAPPGSRTVNYDYMLVKLMVLIAGAAGMVAGAALAAGGAVVSALGRLGVQRDRLGRSED
jgi:hypothetical protein